MPNLISDFITLRELTSQLARAWESWTFGEIGRLRSELLRAPIFAHSSSPGGRYHHSSGRAARWNDQVIHPPPPGNLVNLNECQNGVNHGPPAQVHIHGLSMGDFCYEFPLIFGEIAGEARKGLPFHLCGVLRACVRVILPYPSACCLALINILPARSR